MKINPKTNEAYKLFHNGILAFARVERQGMRVNLKYVERKKKSIIRKMKKLEDEFRQTVFFQHWQYTRGKPVNINSNAQLSHFLYNVKKVKIEKETDSGQGATDEDSLKQLNIPALDLLLERTRYKKPWDVLNGFEKEQVNGCIHPFFNLNIARTYRSSSDSPNFQNIPKRDEKIMQMCRRALYPRPGHQILEIDFKGIEVAIAACYHKDSRMLKYINNPKSDMHGDMAKQIFMVDDFDKSIPEHDVLRQATKNGFIFPQFYGDYYKNCAKNMACDWGKLPKSRWKSGQGIPMPKETLADHFISKKIMSLNMFESHIKRVEQNFWTVRFSEYEEWKERWWKIYQKYGYFDTLTGFRCSGIMNKKEVINYPIQGSAFHCLLWSFVRLDKIIQKEKWDTKIISQIHDSIILDVNPDELKHVVRIANRVTTKELPRAWKWIITPLSIDMEICPVDGSWAQKEKFKFREKLV